MMVYARFVRWAFTRLYREFAWAYDIVAAAVSGGGWAGWARAAAPFLYGRILELGCGTGNLQLELANQPAVGLDVSRQMLAITREKLVRAGIPARLARADARELPFLADSFDTVVATFPSEYIVADTTIAEIQRVLRPGGRLVVVLAAHFGQESLYARMVALAYRLTLQHPIAYADTPPRSALGSHLARAGWLVEEHWAPEPQGIAQLHVISAEIPA